METIELLKLLLNAGKKAGRYLNKNRNNTSVQTRKSRKRKLYFYLAFIAFFFVGFCLVALFAANNGGSNNEVSKAVSSYQQKSLSSLITTQAQASSTAVDNMLNKETTLRASANAALTAYPANSASTLSSSTVDTKTGLQSYMHAEGEGGIARSTIANDTPPAPCKPNSSTDFSAKGQDAGKVPGSEDGGCDQQFSGDLLTGYQGGGNGFSGNGLLFTYPSNYTVGDSQNPSVVSTLTETMQWIASLCLAPIIALIGFRVMTGAAVMRFANAFEDMPRLVLAVIGVAFSLTFAQQLLLIGQTLTQMVVATALGANPNLDITSIIMPVSQWQGWLIGLIVMGIVFTLAQAVAPAAILGNVYGFLIAIGLLLGVEVALIATMHDYLILFLSMGLAIQIFIRLITIDLYIILSPLAIMAAALPGRTGESFAKDWLFGFCALLAAQVAQAIVLVIGLELVHIYEQAPSGTYYSVVDQTLKIAVLLLMIRVPGIFKSNATAIIGQAGSAASGATIGQYSALLK